MSEYLPKKLEIKENEIYVSLTNTPFLRKKNDFLKVVYYEHGTVGYEYEGEKFGETRDSIFRENVREASYEEKIQYRIGEKKIQPELKFELTK